MPAWLKRAHKGAEIVSTAMFAAIFVLSLVAVFMRYVMGRPLAWPDELVMILLVWTTFLTEALVLSEREQVTFDVIYDLCGPPGRRALGLVGSLAIAAMFLVALPTIYGYVVFLWRERTNVLGWRLDLVYACFVVYWIAVIIRAAVKFASLSGGNWRARVADAAPGERTNVVG